MEYRERWGTACRARTAVWIIVCQALIGCQCRGEFRFQTNGVNQNTTTPSDPAESTEAIRGAIQEDAGDTAAQAATGTRAAATAAGGSEKNVSAVLRARNAQGVPLHAGDGDDAVSLRVPDGTAVTLLERGAHKGWYKVRTASGQEGWVTRRYIEKAASAARAGDAQKGGAATGAQAAIALGSPWRSLPECEAALAQGHTRTRALGVARIGSWNLHWFPDGVPGGEAPQSGGNNVPWTACLIAWLNVDVLAVQEAKSDAHTVAKWKELQDNLNRLTHGDWTHQVDPCPNKGRQHVGFVYDRHHVKATLLQTLDSLNPTRSACGGDQRPGFSGYFRFPGGLDLHLVSAHLKSFPDKESYGKRQTALAGLPAAMQTLLSRDADTDRIVLGDFNTMGCEDCSPVLSGADERDRIKAQLAALPDPLELRSGANCSHYYQKKPGLLDQVLVSSKLQELSFSTAVQVAGLCELFSCSPLPGAAPAVYREVSDHCPLLLDIADKDLD